MTIQIGQAKLDKIEKVKEILTKKGIIFSELKNGQLQVDRINYWATSDKWYDPITNSKGVGINSFLKYLKDNNII